MVQKYEKRLKDGKYFNKFGIISREIGCLGTSPNQLMQLNNEVMNGIYRKSIKQRIERFFEKVHECILIFTDRLG